MKFFDTILTEVIKFCLVHGVHPAYTKVLIFHEDEDFRWFYSDFSGSVEGKNQTS